VGHSLHQTRSSNDRGNEFVRLIHTTTHHCCNTSSSGRSIDEWRSSLSNICSFQCRLKTKLPTLQRKQRDIFQWLKELDYLTFSSLLTVSSLMTHLSEPKSLRNICYLRWTVSNGQIRIERAKGPSNTNSWHRSELSGKVGEPYGSDISGS
jgi:hypothetical protein